ncbi:hypothetical protein AGLY_004233 [Aphis glycines]|uniref:Uncharacterized protein n=1 Tax=Aphis glycines TaxID=307491 RepID=A0A6G0TXW3_APHGL|nr:hypothetical protein AGLY_004233 [Aphis glycines]
MNSILNEESSKEKSMYSFQAKNYLPLYNNKYNLLTCKTKSRPRKSSIVLGSLVRPQTNRISGDPQTMASNSLLVNIDNNGTDVVQNDISRFVNSSSASKSRTYSNPEHNLYQFQSNRQGQASCHTIISTLVQQDLNSMDYSLVVTDGFSMKQSRLVPVSSRPFGVCINIESPYCSPFVQILYAYNHCMLIFMLSLTEYTMYGRIAFKLISPCIGINNNAV